MKVKPLLYLLVIIAMGFWACEQDPGPAQRTASSPPIPSPGPQPADPPARPEARAPALAWPFGSAGPSDGIVADNLTARNFILVFDGSGSMNESECAGSSRKIEIAKQAVVAWSKSIPPDANLGLYAFHNNGIATLPLSAGNRGHRNQFMQSVLGIRAGGNTPLTQAVLHSYEALTEQGRQQLGYGEYTIVVVTDGIANNVNQLKRAVDLVLTASPVQIFSIGFCIGPRHSLNQPGRTLYTAADNPEQLRQGLEQVLAEAEVFDDQEFSE